MFLTEFREKHDVDDGVLLVDSIPWLTTALLDHKLRFRYEKCIRQNTTKYTFKRQMVY